MIDIGDKRIQLEKEGHLAILTIARPEIIRRRRFARHVAVIRRCRERHAHRCDHAGCESSRSAATAYAYEHDLV